MRIPVIKVKDMETGQVHIVGTDPMDNLQIDVNGNVFYHKENASVKREMLSVEFMEPAKFLELMMMEMMDLPANTSIESMKECVATGMAIVIQTFFEKFEKLIKGTMDIVTKGKTFHLTPYNYMFISYFDRGSELVNPDERYCVHIVREFCDGRAQSEEIIRLKDEKMAEYLSNSISIAIKKNLRIFDVEKWLSKYEDNENRTLEIKFPKSFLS